jgi:hypothetical protein
LTQTLEVEAAVKSYLAKMPPTQRSRSDAYFEGGYWLLVWDFLSTVIAMWLLLHFRWSAHMRNLAERITRFQPLQTAIYWIQFIVVVSVFTFPLTIYESYYREHKYGLLNQTFGPWMGDQAKMLAVGVVLGTILFIPLFGLVRRLGANWWVWGAILMVVFFAFVSLIAPVYVFPLFNKYTKLEDPHIKDPILNMARANGIRIIVVIALALGRLVAERLALRRIGERFLRSGEPAGVGEGQLRHEGERVRGIEVGGGLDARDAEFLHALPEPVRAEIEERAAAEREVLALDHPFTRWPPLTDTPRGSPMLEIAARDCWLAAASRTRQPRCRATPNLARSVAGRALAHAFS